jgi:8-oxo-dGTP diphosphatase
MSRTIKVAAAVIRDDAGRVLIARRRTGKAFAHKWEFPGGKIEEGETPEQCLVRELREEFDIEADVGAHVASSQAQYAELTIELHAYATRYLRGHFQLTDHDAVAWVAPDVLTQYEMPEPDVPIVEAVLARAMKERDR